LLPSPSITTSKKTHHCCPRTLEIGIVAADFIELFALYLLLQNQVYRGVAESAEEDFSSDPIGRRRLGQKLLPFDHKAGTLSRLYKPLGPLFLSNRSLFIWRPLTAK